MKWKCGKPRAVRRWGATAVETAVVIPIALFLIFAAIEFGRYLLILHLANNAARTGARVAIVNCTTSSPVVLGAMTDTAASNTIRGIVNGQMAGVQKWIDAPPANPYNVVCYQAITNGNTIPNPPAPTAAQIGQPLTVGYAGYVAPGFVPQTTTGFPLADDWKNAGYGAPVAVVVTGGFTPLFVSSGVGYYLNIPRNIRAVAILNSEA